MNWTHEFRLSSPLDITAASRLELPEYAVDYTAARNRTASPWNGSATYGEAVALAETGWIGAPRLDILAEQIAPSETRHTFDMQHAVAGAFVDVSRYLEGHPECMLEFCDEPAPRSISLAVDLAKGHGETPRQLELAGAVALAVLDTLAASKVSAELTGIASIQSYVKKGNRSITTGKCTLTSFPICRASEPIDPNQLAFWLCHPAALRSLIFGFWDTCPKGFYTDTKQHDQRGVIYQPTTDEVGVDYILSTSPANETEAASEYSRIMKEIQAAI